MNISCASGNREEMNLRDIFKIKSTRLRGCFVIVNKEGRSIKDNTMTSNICVWMIIMIIMYREDTIYQIYAFNFYKPLK